MAAGDINIDGIQISPEGLARLVAAVTQNIEAKSNDPGQIEVIDSLNGVTSIPVLQQIGSTVKLVRVLVSILRGVDGREVFLQVTETHLQWRYTDGMWDNLIALADLKGDKGETPVLRTNSNGIEWKYESEEEDAWKELVSYETLKLKFTDLTSEQIDAFWRSMPEDIQLLLQKPAQDAADKVIKEVNEVKANLTADVEALEERAETVLRETGESKELVDQATKDAKDAAALAQKNADFADTAAKTADEKAGKADKIANETLLVKQQTEKVKENAEEAIKFTVGAATLAEKQAGVATDAARIAAEQAGVAEKAAGKADKATEAAVKAADRATTLSNNRDKIISGYWWKYDEELQDYVNTTIRATGETGQGLNIVSRYLTVDELKAAYPSGVVGCFEIGNESPYEIWYYDAPASEWRNSGRLQGPQGMSAFQVWKLQPGNEDKTELDFYRSLLPYIGENLNWWVDGKDQGYRAPGKDAHSPYIHPESKNWVEYDDELQEYVERVCLAEGISAKIEIVKNTPTEFIVKLIDAYGEKISPNLIVRPVSNNGVLDIDHEPMVTDTHYILEGVEYPYMPGQEVRFKDSSGDITFYKCYNNSDAGAIWEEAGSGGAPIGNIYLQGANYFNDSVQIIKQGYLKNE